MYGRDRMRFNPRSVMSGGDVFLVDRFNELDHNTNEGCRVNILERDDKKVTRWKLVRSKDANGQDIGLDYYFPYIHGHNVGWVKVSDPADGTIVTTGLMDGCALEVCLHSDGSFVFYHDTNGCQMYTVRNAGTTLCRIEGDAYLDDATVTSLTAANKIPVAQFVCVYKGNFWHVGCFGILVNPDMKAKQYEIKGAFIPPGGCYRGYFNENIHLIQRGVH